MSELVESLYRLYKNGMINEEKIKNLLKEGKITAEECRFILREEG